jgi:hypothetical protein
MAKDGEQQGTPKWLDINGLVRKGELEVSIRSPENWHDARARRTREIITFATAVAMVAVVFLACLGILIFGYPSVEEQRWLQSALTLILGAAVGAAFKRC